jgi:Ca2+-binding RTX toxin-like protein
VEEPLEEPKPLPEKTPVWFMSSNRGQTLTEESLDATDEVMENVLGFGTSQDDNFGNNLGNEGNRLYGNGGDDQIFLGNRDRAFGGNGDDILNASLGTGNNRAYGGDGNDQFFAGVNDFYAGGNGDDLFFAGTGGNNKFVGGSGSDTFWLANEGVIPTQANIVTDFEAGVDTLGINGFDLTFSDLEIRQEGSSAIVSLSNNDLATLLNTEVQNLGVEDFSFA